VVPPLVPPMLFFLLLPVITGLALLAMFAVSGRGSRHGRFEFLIQIQRVLERYDTSKQQDPYRDGTPAYRRKGSLARDPKALG
jgi:hypothetical protein